MIFFDKTTVNMNLKYSNDVLSDDESSSLILKRNRNDLDVGYVIDNLLPGMKEHCFSLE